jgi:type I restriction enzyme, S subunit
VQSVTRSHQRANPEDIAKIWLPVPPLSEQRSIAGYLDRETGRLDGLVAAKERWLALLAEKRRALITRAITRGLNERAPLRDSGIHWLGEIPKHWEVVPFRWYFQINSGDFLSNDEFSPEKDPSHTIPVVGGNGVSGYTHKANVEGETIVVGRVGALCGNVHFITGEAWVTDNALLLSAVKGYAPEYLATLLRCMNLNSLANQTAQPLVTGSMIRDMKGVLPSLNEQRAIVAHIASETAKLDGLRAATERTIALLKERRAALIVAAVTGKIDLQGVRCQTSSMAQERRPHRCV